VVHADEVMAPREVMDDDGVVHQYEELLTGEAMGGGPLMLSWTDVRDAGESADWAYNVVIHEFAHKLDMLNGDANGFPPLHPGMDREAWPRAFGAAYDDFCRRVARGEPSAIDAYAAEHPSEFFAVLSEAFFETPAAVRAEYRDVYRQLAAFYRQDPAARQERQGGQS